MKICSLIITYQPNVDMLSSVINSILPQVNSVLIIDNGSINAALLKEFESNEKIDITFLPENLGIAKATNIGLAFFEKKDADYIILSDQDTVYPSDYVNNFQKFLSNCNVSNVAAFSPVFFDINSNEYKPLYVEKKHRIEKVSYSNTPVTVFQAIASGLIIDMKKFINIGGMNEALFIDYVDFEWCWRVNSAGYKILCLPQLKIEHHLGEGIVSVGGKKISEHSFVRYYYITRNTFYLSLYTPYLGSKMKMQLFLKAILYPFGYSILCKPHLLNTKYTLKGMFNGIFKKLGKIN